MSLRIRRGTDAQRTNPGITPDQGELIYTTDTKKLYIGDGSTLGGVNVGQSLAGTGLVFDAITQTLQATAPQSSGITAVSSDLNPSLGGNLNLNNKNITGTGTVGIVGTMYATQGLGGDLSLNTHNITGTGNISISGTLSVTGLGADLAMGSRNITGSGNISTSGTISAGSLGADLSLGGKNITGTGSINTTGTITITGALSAGSISTGGTLSGNSISTAGTLSAGNTTLNSVTTNTIYAPDSGVGLQIIAKANNSFSLDYYNGTAASPTAIATGPGSGMSMSIKGWTGSLYGVSGSIVGQWDVGANLSDLNPKSTIALASGAGGVNNNFAGLTSNGTWFSSILAAVGPSGTGFSGSGTYPSPALAGMIIFDSSNSHFYGYNGTTWKQLDN